MKTKKRLNNQTITKKITATHLNYLAWLISIIATLGSLFFSEIMKLPPCTLCWYQRIAMYPLVIILAVGLFKKNTHLHDYALPFSLIGLGIATHHNLLYYHLIPESLAPCTLGVSCTTRYLEWFGFVTIPLLSLTAFCLITILMGYAKKISPHS